jgi:Mg-chelatase subunit ChlI
MTPDERERMAILCERLAKEQDPHKFTQFIEQLNDLLKAKERRLEKALKDKPN